MRKKHRETLAAIFRHPTPSDIRWQDAMALLQACGAEIEERGGSMTAVLLNDELILLHRPHPGNEIDKGAVASLRRFLGQVGIGPT
ncbi:MAG: type II toxin-antitoxin system HicA family toxin [Chloroflexi bacterium]|nr:type II toxin-antitoxin system HicA family toxin [Chloroflexota bacterium]